MYLDRWIPRIPVGRTTNPVRGRPARNRPSRALGEVTTSEQVLLCSFGLNRDGGARRTATHLREALVEAGFRATVARHLVHTSPLLRRTGDGDYLLRRFDASLRRP